METSAFKEEKAQHCFLCGSYLSNNTSSFDKISADLNAKAQPSNFVTKSVENGDNKNSQRVPSSVKYSLLSICRYLKLNLKQILKVKEGENAEKENLLLKQFPIVALCEKCGEFVEQLTGLCRKLEVIKMKVNDKLLNFQTYLERMETQDSQPESDCQLLTTLRTRLKTSCENKLRRLLPRVELEACNYTQQTEDNDSNLNASEPIVLKIECGDIDIQDYLEETPTLISAQPKRVRGLQRQCDLCGKQINRGSLARHQTFFCKFKITKTSTQLLLKEEKKHGCKICHKWFGESTSFKKHIRTAHPSTSAATGDSKVKEVKCEHCDKFINKKNMRRHLALHCPNNPNIEHPATDPLGEKELESHLLKQVGSNILVACQCGKMITNSKMSYHKRVWCKLGPRLCQAKKKRTCKICGEEYENLASYLQHRKKAHYYSNYIPTNTKNWTFSDNGKAKCNKCGAMISRYGIWKHTNVNCPFGPRLPNPQKKPRACNVCGKMYKSTPNMLRHRGIAHPEYVKKSEMNSVSSSVSIKSKTTPETNDGVNFN